MTKKNLLFFGGVGLMAIIGLSLIVHSCSNDTPVVQQPMQQVGVLPQPQIIERERIVEHDSGSSAFQNFLLWHYMFGGPSHTVVVQQPTPVYRPAPLYQPAVVNKTVQNITINQTVNNHAPAPVAPAASAAPQAAKSNPVPAPSAAQATPPAPPASKASFWSTPAQVVKASTAYPKAQSSNAASYSMKSSYSGYKASTSYRRK